jgi:hypothetical protein
MTLFLKVARNNDQDDVAKKLRTQVEEKGNDKHA